MKSKKELSSRLIQKGDSQPIKSDRKIDTGFYQNIHHYPDIKTAASFVQDYALNEAAVDSGHGLEENKEKIEEVSLHCEPLEAELGQLNERKRQTPATIKSAVNEQGEIEGRPFRKWSGRHQILCVLCAFLMFISMGVGLTNSAIVLLASGEPVFLEAPYRAWLMGLIVPMAGAALKLPTSFIEYEAIRKRYALTIIMTAAFSLGVWAFFYAAEYKGLTGGMNMESLLETDNKSSYLVFFQLLAEVFASAAFALCVEHIYRLYCPDHFQTNPEYRLITEQIKSLEGELKPLREQKVTLHARIVGLEKKRENYAADKVAAFYAESSRRRNFQ
ncbi:MAG: hypothetical protein DHS20C09_07590 [marine bacterium B5-7]|nr:MAG: hypothetical protein DHS20C09_07590 [marine bacterium B5-7]